MSARRCSEGCPPSVRTLGMHSKGFRATACFDGGQPPCHGVERVDG